MKYSSYFWYFRHLMMILAKMGHVRHVSWLLRCLVMNTRVSSRSSYWHTRTGFSLSSSYINWLCICYVLHRVPVLKSIVEK